MSPKQKKEKKKTLAITGNPGVGKHTVAKLVADRLGPQTVTIDLNKLAIEHGAILKKTPLGLDVDVKKLARLVRERVRVSAVNNNVLIVGHLVPYVVRPVDVDLVAVLRRSPYELVKTFAARGYSAEKSRENAASEILGVVFSDALKAFGRRKVAEFDTTGRTPDKTADEIIKTLNKLLQKRVGVVDWLAMVAEKGDMQKFFDLGLKKGRKERKNDKGK
jgi:adenylate kinase